MLAIWPDLLSLSAVLSKFALYLTGIWGAGLLFIRFSLGGGDYPFAKPILICALVGFFASVALFALQAALLMGDLSGALDPEILSLLYESAAGTALLWRVIGFAAIVLGLLFGVVALSLIGALGVLWSFAQIGHIHDQQMYLLRLGLLLHLVSVAFWIGILAPLCFLAQRTDSLAEAALLGHRFGQWAVIAIPLLIGTGASMAFMLTGTIAAFWTPYGMVLAFKIMSVAILLALGALNKTRFVPRMRRGDGLAAGHLVRVIGLEWVGFVIILILTAALTNIGRG